MHQKSEVGTHFLPSQGTASKVTAGLASSKDASITTPRFKPVPEHSLNENRFSRIAALPALAVPHCAMENSPREG